MAHLSAVQIAQYAKSAGFSGNNLITAIAVALAESTGSTTALNPHTKCAGLWQIHPVHKKSHPTWTQSWLYQPGNNAKAAFVISSGGKNWRPWEAFTNGAYKRHLSAAQAAVRSVGGSASIVPIKVGAATTGVTAARVIAIAASQIGYTESPRGSNRTKYWSDLGVNQGQQWCGGFTTWCLRKAGMSMSKIKSFTGANPYHIPTMKVNSKRKKTSTQTPRPGYLVLFTWQHVALVEKVLPNGDIQTIEGNTSPSTRGSQNNGGCVARKVRKRSSIHSFIRIDYDAGGPINAQSPDWTPGVDTEKGDIDAKGILDVNGIFNMATSEVLARYFGFNGSGDTKTATYWKNIEKVAGFPVRWQDGLVDTETVQFIQWATEQKVTGVWNTRCIVNMQTFLNEFTKGKKPSYKMLMEGAKQ